jgi:hypothetical protein
VNAETDGQKALFCAISGSGFQRGFMNSDFRLCFFSFGSETGLWEEWWQVAAEFKK